MSTLKKVIKKVLGSIGYGVYKIPVISRQGYEQIMPNATYAPWQLDKEFLKIYDIIKYNTLVDKYRCYELWQLISQTSKLNGAIIEIGVWRGGTGGLICKRLELDGNNHMVYLADTFSGVVKASKYDSFYKGTEHSDTSKQIVFELLNKLQVKNYSILEGIFPDETSHLIKDNLFCFCHIDVDVYFSAKDIVDWLWPRLTMGGIIVYDDYGFASCDGITKFVNEEIHYNDRIVIHNLNGHAIIIKIK